MNQNKAQRLLHKIQAFLDNDHGQDLSRLERDLIKSYIVQLYDAVTEVEGDDSKRSHPETSFQGRREELVEKPIEKFHEPEKQEPIRYEAPKLKETVQPHVEPVQPSYQEYKPAVKEVVQEEIKSESENKWSSPPVTEQREVKVEVQEPVRESLQQESRFISGEQQEALHKLFDLHKTEEMAHRFGHVVIPSIESAMGLNERIFTLNELFGGDKSLFDATCSRLNQFHSFDEAKDFLIQGPARDFKWEEPKRQKMAEQFLRIVYRRYPKPVH